jgi:hypothetical protein
MFNRLKKLTAVFKTLRLALIVSSMVVSTTILQAQPIDPDEKQSESNAEMKAFIMSATYGVLAGALVGAATLAFTDNPSDHLRNVAKGASLGLYAGLLLGAYVVYLVPGQMEKQRQQEEEQLGVKNMMILPDVQISENGQATYVITSQFSF